MPPPSQGYLTLAGAWVAEAAGLGTDPDDPAVGPPPRGGVARRGPRPSRRPLRRGGRRGAARRRAPRRRRGQSGPAAAAAPDVAPGQGTPGGSVARIAEGDTTHLCALDADGLGVSLTQSNALDFGSHLIEPATGVFLHNRGVGFSLVPGHPAELSPGRRPPHTLSPMLVTAADGALTHLVGAMGGDAQPQIIVQLLARLLHAGQDPATAVCARRGSPSTRPPPGRSACGGATTSRCWSRRTAHPGGKAAWPTTAIGCGRIRAFDPVAVGCAQIIAVEGGADGSRRLVGASDPRSPEGAAIGR